MYTAKGRLDNNALLAQYSPLVRRLAQLARTDVLILDDWALAPIGPAERADLSPTLMNYPIAESEDMPNVVFSP